MLNVLRFAAGSLSWALVFALLVISARVLGPQDFGRFAWAFAFAFLFEPLLDAGFYRLTIRKAGRRCSPEAAAVATARYLGHAIAWKSLVGFLLFASIAFGILPTGPGESLGIVVSLMLAGTIARSANDAVRSALVARGNFVRDVLSLVFERVALVALGSFALFTGGRMAALSAMFFLAHAVALAFTLALSSGCVRVSAPLLESRYLRPLFGTGAVVAFAAMTCALSGNIDAAIIGTMRNATEVGWFVAAHWTRGALLVVPGVLGACLVPRLARLHHDDPAAFEAVFGGGVKYACALGMALAANGMVLAPSLLEGIFGEAFGHSADTLRVLLLGLPPVFGLTFLQTSLLSFNRGRNALALVFAGLVLNVVLAFGLVPSHGPVGAAAATVVAETALFLAVYAAVRRRLPGIAGAVFVKAPAALMTAAAGAWFASGHGIAVEIAFANAAFATSLLFFGFVAEPERRAMLRGLVSALRRSPAGVTVASEALPR